MQSHFMSIKGRNLTVMCFWQTCYVTQLFNFYYMFIDATKLQHFCQWPTSVTFTSSCRWLSILAACSLLTRLACSMARSFLMRCSSASSCAVSSSLSGSSEFSSSSGSSASRLAAGTWSSLGRLLLYRNKLPCKSLLYPIGHTKVHWLHYSEFRFITSS